MTSSTQLDAIDLVTDDAVRELATFGEQPCVSISMPTHRHGPDTLQGPVRLRQLLERATEELGATQGLTAGEAAELLGPATALTEDEAFWQRQAQGLVIYLAPGFERRFRVPAELPEGVVVGSVFRLRPLIPLVSGDGTFDLLSLSREQIRLFEASRLSIRELELTDMPTSFDEAIAPDDPDGNLRARSSNGSFHGHGGAAERDPHDFERFVRAIDPGVRRHIGGDRRPLVIAGLAEKAAAFKAASGHPTILDKVVEGHPREKRPEELHAAAWEIAEPFLAGRAERAIDHYGQLSATDRTADSLPEIIEAAAAGRVSALLVAEGDKVLGRVDQDGRVRVGGDGASEDLVDHAIALTLRGRGAVFAVAEGRLPGAPAAAAVMRY